MLALAGVGVAPAHGQSNALSGRFRIAAGACDGAPSGSYFRMILPTGGVDGPFISNSDSRCGDKTYTALDPGMDGGLLVGTYQPEPSPGFDGSGNSLAVGITKPTRFFGVDFSTSTNEVDPQTKAPAPVPVVSVGADGSLSGDLSAFAASWNNQEFNQGAPKPDGSTPGLTAAPSGTLETQTGAFTLEWRSEIVGGPFDRFTGVWHLEGTFESDGAVTNTPPPSAAPTAGGDSSTGDTAGQQAPSGLPGNATSPTVSGAPTTVGGASSTTSESSSAGHVGASAGRRSPNVVVARSTGGSGGSKWVAVPAGLGVLVVGAFATRAWLRRRQELVP